MKLMSPLVEESWEVTGLLPSSSGSIFLASCFPSSTLRKGRERVVRMLPAQANLKVIPALS